MNAYDLEGRVAVVTGGAQGIGLAVARRLSASGATVALWDLDGALAAESAAGLGAGARGDAVDVTDIDAVASLAKMTANDLGSLDIKFLCTDGKCRAQSP